MTDNPVASVVAGLAIGILFVTIFSVIPYSSSLDSRLIASTMNMREAQVFVSEYPSAKIEVDRAAREVPGTAVKYSSAKVDYDKEVQVEIRMYVMVDETTGEPTGEIHIDCSASNLNTIGSRFVIPILPSDTVAFLKETECAR